MIIFFGKARVEIAVANYFGEHSEYRSFTQCVLAGNSNKLIYVHHNFSAL